MLRQDVKTIVDGNILPTTVWCADDMAKRGIAYIIGEPYEFPKVAPTPAPVIEEEVDE